MSTSAPEIAHLLAAVAALMVAAHTLGTLFARFRQPRVIGEIAAGLVLGPTLPGHLAPGLESRLFPATGLTPSVLGAVYQLGLLLLLFCSGTQIRSALRRTESKTAGWVFTTGMLLPFLAGLGGLHVFNLRSSWGPHGNAASFLLVFAIAMAVTSIPVISKIMHDLGILDTAFARVVLGVAVAEDLVLYVILAVALGLAQGSEATLFGLPSLLRISPGTPADMAYHVGATLAILAAALAFIPIYFAIVGLQLDLLHGFSIVFFLLFLLLACAIKAGSVYFGARLAGETSSSSLNLAIALNARGGPGIVVASVAYAAGIINQSFYAALVMLAIVTSLFAGSWLARIPKEELLAEQPVAARPLPWRARKGSSPEPSDP